MKKDPKDSVVMGERPYGGLDPAMAQVALDQILASPSGVGLNHAQQVERLGRLVDLSGDLGRQEGIEQALETGARLLEKELSDQERALLHYTMGNAHDIRSALAPAPASPWNDEAVGQQIIHLRQARRLGGTDQLERVRRCQILTNLGNLMSRCGRITDAMAYWDEALTIQPDFSMALGNRGWGLMRYAAHVHDPGHQILHLRAAYRSLTRALAQPAVRLIVPGAADHFAKRLAFLVRKVGRDALEAPAHIHAFRADMGDAERGYRSWCLRERLFLNDLNELGADPVAAADVLTLPDLTTSKNDGLPSALGMFNQLKQGFVSARFLFFEGMEATGTHFSDREVTLVNTLDYAQYGLATEKLKLAYRSAYSLLDQLAFLLNDYLALGIAEKSVSFRGLWFSDEKRKVLKPQFVDRAGNEPLQALFWLSRDIYEREGEEFAEALEPDAKRLSTIRNHLEHKYLRLHLFAPPEPATEKRPPFLGDQDPLAFSITRDDFVRRALHVLRLARGALVYLTLAMNVEEEGKRAGRSGSGRIASIPLDALPDDDKL